MSRVAGIGMFTVGIITAARTGIWTTGTAVKAAPDGICGTLTGWLGVREVPSAIKILDACGCATTVLVLDSPLGGAVWFETGGLFNFFVASVVCVG